MPAFNFTIKEGTSRRIQLTCLDANGAPYVFTSTTVEFIAKEKSTDTVTSLSFSLVVDATGAGVSSPADRIFLGRPNPADYDGPLIDTLATSGMLTIRFDPVDTTPLVTTANKPFVYEARVRTAGSDVHTLASGTVTVEDSLFDN